MPFSSVTLTPGINSERTPTLLRAGYASSSLVRFKDSLVQKIGGWQKYYPLAVGGVPRELHAWEDLNQTVHLAVGTTTELDVITNSSLQVITPQTLTSDFAPNFSTTSGSPTIDIVDPNIANVTTYDSILFNVPVSQGGIVLFGVYQITQITGVTSYQITAKSNALRTEANPTATNAITAIGNNTLNFAATPAWVSAGMVVFNLTNPASIPSGARVSSVGGTTVVMTANAVAPGVGNGDNIVFSSVPVFTTLLDSAIVSVYLKEHGVSAGETAVFQSAATGNGVTISGGYNVLSVVDANNFTITVSAQANASGSFAMNGGRAELMYIINIGPPPGGSGYGLGGYGLGGYGTGTVPAEQTGTEITSTDWSIDNWGQILLACPRGGGVYFWDPTGGFQTATLITTAPAFNNVMFVNMAQQILVTLGSSVEQQLGIQQQPMLVQWSDVSNFFEWTPSVITQAGNFTLSVGSQIMGGFATSNQNLIWTDLDLWSMNYIGPPDVFGFTKIGAGAGLVSAHAAQQLRGAVYWMGRTNFYAFTGGGVSVIPCPVWDAVFQNLNTNFLQNIRSMPNTPFNEVGWEFPSLQSGDGENDSYVKMNITEPGNPWDYGIATGPLSSPMPRSAWIDQTVLRMPIVAKPKGVIYQHEISQDADGSPIVATFETGYFYIAEGEEFAFVDQIIPDFKFGTFGGAGTAQIQISFNVLNFPGDTPVTYGPYTFTSATQYISVRFRGRLMSITVSSSDIGSFWRLGSCKYRWSPAGRR